MSLDMLPARGCGVGHARLLLFASALLFCLPSGACAADEAKQAAQTASSPPISTISKEASATPPAAVAGAKAAAPGAGALKEESKAGTSTVLKQPSGEIASTAPPKAQAIPKAKRRGKRDAIDTALATFDSFCGEWQRMLRDREDNNLRKLTFTRTGEHHRAAYKGYGKIDACTCREVKGFAIGKLGYNEFDYYLVGNTPEEAKKAKPQVSGTTRTTEIFRWERGKWFY